MRNPPNGTAPKSFDTNKKNHVNLAGQNTIGNHKISNMAR